MTESVFTCPAGSFTGFESDFCLHLRGIRYATSCRFGVPVPYVYPCGIHPCISPAPYAVQLRSAAEGNFTGMDYENQIQEESCQFLSMTLPLEVEEDEKLPVMVWIHGGAYRNGGCDAISYDRSRMVRENHVMIVGINYRVGILGFTRNLEGNFANLGLLDQIEALKWIQQNIAYFGGDPDNVTIFGQSSGADAVRCLMMADGTEGLFHRCIMQSPPLGTLDGRENMEQKILDEVNNMPLDVTIEEVREVQASVTAHVTEKGNAKNLIFGPHEGVYPLPPKSERKNRIRQAASKYDLLIGSNSREVSAYLVTNQLVRKLDSFPLTRWIIESVIRKKSQDIFITPTEKFAKDFAAYGGNVHLYSFTWGAGRSFVGACHMMDYLPLFGSDHLKIDLAKMGMEDAEIHTQGIPMRRIWADFAKTGHVNTTGIEGMLTFLF